MPRSSAAAMTATAPNPSSGAPGRTTKKTTWDIRGEESNGFVEFLKFSSLESCFDGILGKFIRFSWGFSMGFNGIFVDYEKIVGFMGRHRNIKYQWRFTAGILQGSSFAEAGD